MKILKNIADLNPDVVIHTDMVPCATGYRPQSAYYFHRDSHDPTYVISTIMPTATSSHDIAALFI